MSNSMKNLADICTDYFNWNPLATAELCAIELRLKHRYCVNMRQLFAGYTIMLRH